VNDFIKRIGIRAARRVVLTVASLAITLLWWSIRPGDSNNAHQDSLPDDVWGGGGSELTIEAQSNCPAYVYVTFEGAEDAWADKGLLEARENMPAGSHTWTIDVPQHVSGIVELGVRQPEVGNELSWRLFVDGQLVDEQSQALREELEPGWGFALQMGFDDFANAQLAQDW
jgi:hypothetical protein